jgi:hypothetical protein
VLVLTRIRELFRSDLAETPATLAEAFHGFSQYFQANVGQFLDYATTVPSESIQIDRESYSSKQYNLDIEES